jgi:hypothetical protein
MREQKQYCNHRTCWSSPSKIGYYCLVAALKHITSSFPPLRLLSLSLFLRNAHRTLHHMFLLSNPHNKIHPNITIAMYLSAPTLFAFAASASAVALLRSAYGSWDLTLYVDADKAQYIFTKYTTNAYPEGLRSTCI